MGNKQKEGPEPLSTYTSYALSGIKNREVLLAAIATLGLQAQVYEQAHSLAGFYSHDNKRKGHVVIPKSEFSRIGVSSYVDVGFEQMADGTFQVHTDGHYPTMIPDPKGEGRVKVEDAVQSAYKKVNGDKALSLVITKTIPRLKALGKIPANATVKKQALANGTTRVLVSY